jgi:Fe2+ or Zn2+ uptake regulation protein
LVVILRGVKFRLKRRVKKMNVCTRCESTMDRRTAIPEAAGRRYWGDVEPYVYVGDAEIHHFICTNCGNLTAIQFKEAA